MRLCIFPPGIQTHHFLKMNKIKSWLMSESGFEVFEMTGLTIGGIAIALFVGSVALSISFFEYIKIGNVAVGNEVEVNAALQRFH